MGELSIPLPRFTVRLLVPGKMGGCSIKTGVIALGLLSMVVSLMKVLIYNYIMMSVGVHWVHITIVVLRIVQMIFAGVLVHGARQESPAHVTSFIVAKTIDTAVMITLLSMSDGLYIPLRFFVFLAHMAPAPIEIIVLIVSTSFLERLK